MKVLMEDIIVGVKNLFCDCDVLKRTPLMSVKGDKVQRVCVCRSCGKIHYIPEDENKLEYEYKNKMKESVL